MSEESGKAEPEPPPPSGLSALRAEAEAAAAAQGQSALRAAAAEAAAAPGQSALRAAAAEVEANRFAANRAYASLPKTLADQVKLESAALNRSLESLRTSAAAYVKSDHDRSLKAQLLKDQVDSPAPTRELSISAIDRLRESSLARRESEAAIEAASQTALMSAHMATVASDLSAISNTLINEVLPAWHDSDTRSQRTTRWGLWIAAAALAVSAVLTGVQIWLNRADRQEDLKRAAAEEEQADQRERAALARHEQSQRDMATTHELLRALAATKPPAKVDAGKEKIRTTPTNRQAK